MASAVEEATATSPVRQSPASISSLPVAAGSASWEDFPPSARKAMLWWVISATKDDTRAWRIAVIVRGARLGERAQG